MIQEKSLILPFTHIRATDLSLVGGKGANLGELSHAGLPVPPGFCLTTVAFQQFIESCPNINELYDLLETITSDDVEMAREVGDKVRQTLLEIPIPPNIVDVVKHTWRELGEDEAYAVRSSATAEDLPDASFAGQQDTFLNICGEADLLDTIRRCWVSLFTDRAILYRYQNGFPHRGVQLSVIVQQMVMAEKSGVLFTANPLTGHRHTLAIDASFGLGEALVSGLVSPDTYRVDKRDSKIIERHIADKQVAIYPEKDGGVRQENLSETQRHQIVLSDEQILQLAELGIQVEAHYASPQDIEWAFADNKIYLLQARPITSLYPINNLKSPDDTLHIFFNIGYQQNMTNAMSPFSISAMKCAIPLGHFNNAIESTYARTSMGRFYVDLTKFLRHPILRRGILRGLGQFNALAPETLKTAMQRQEFQAPHGIAFSWTIFRGIFQTFYRVLTALWWQDLTGLASRVNGIIEQHLEVVNKKLNEAPTGEAQIRAIIDILRSFFGVMLQWAPYFATGEIAKRLLVRLGSSWSDEIDLEAVSLGLPGNVVTDMNLVLGDLADTARQSPQLKSLFENLGDDSHAWLEKASQLEDSKLFMSEWQAFIEQYGARGPSEVDIMTQRWYEEPLPLLKVITSYLQQEQGRHRIQHQKLVEARELAVQKLKDKSKQGLFGWLRSRLVNRLIHVVYEASVLREHHKFMMVKMFYVTKVALKQRAVELTANNKLSHPDDIWFLTFPELLEIYRDDAIDTSAIVSTRRSQFERFQKLSAPMVITSDGEVPVVKYQVDDAPEDALIGNPVSSGIVEGIVHVIRNPQSETLKPGEILVAPFTDPGWTPLFINAGGLIMEVGGILTHGSVVAREYGIPAVVGVRDATTTLHTGQKVRIDGNRGIIEIL